MTEDEKDEICKEIDKLISTEMKEIPQSVIFRSGMNTGLRMAKRIVERRGDETLRRHNED